VNLRIRLFGCIILVYINIYIYIYPFENFLVTTSQERSIKAPFFGHEREALSAEKYPMSIQNRLSDCAAIT